MSSVMVSACSRVGTTPSSAACAMPRIVASLVAEKPQPRSADSSVATTCCGAGNSASGYSARKRPRM
eukprot:3809-Eustigmatos_ZCMA.PRE.1